MRELFVQELMRSAELDSRLMLLTADLGYGVFDKFRKSFPNQYINVGVSEQNMIGVASGLALEGHRVVVYSIGNFPTLRCLEQIRNDLCYHELNVLIVASGGGFSYGQLGMSHHATEDIAVMRALPGIRVVAPTSADEAGVLTRELLTIEGPSYLRLDKTSCHPDGSSTEIQLGRVTQLRGKVDTQTEVAICVTGGIALEALRLAERLEHDGVTCKVVGFHTIKPLDQEALLELVHNSKLIVCVEEGTVLGGLGSAIAEFVCYESDARPKVLRFGMKDVYTSIVGDQAYLRAAYGLDAPSMYEELRTIL